MDTRTLSSMLARVAIGATCLISSVACGGEMLRTGRSPVFMVVTNVVGSAGGTGQPSGFLLSDVQVLVEETVNGAVVKVPTYFNDSASATIAIEAKNPTVATTGLNAVTVTRYRVTFRRSDGRNTPGVDVPFGFDGPAGLTIPAGGSGTVALNLIRHQAKLEPPLRNLVGRGGLGFISAIADITFFGRDQNGNEMTTTTSLDVQFGDFADE